mmetsp:Transcript_93521/g.208110  ORF Transcript_93521/g.208110 Transcript_93521/m.208110 type:complete len:140 (+) Transcript_93521:352-771(+)
MVCTVQAQLHPWPGSDTLGFAIVELPEACASRPNQSIRVSFRQPITESLSKQVITESPLSKQLITESFIRQLITEILTNDGAMGAGFLCQSWTGLHQDRVLQRPGLAVLRAVFLLWTLSCQLQTRRGPNKSLAVGLAVQ